jgi:uncharacterized protein YndB with AHSA1/START domain/predicted enzyme related to lactoylglutathione lyase
MPTKTKRPFKKTPAKELVITRTFQAPREVVFKAWTYPKHIAQWWGPRGFTNPVCEWDARPGGKINVHMRGPDGTVYPMGGVFKKVEKPKRLVFITTAFYDKTGKPMLEVTNTIIFDESYGFTEVTLTALVTKATNEAARALSGMEAGWNQSLDKFTEFVGSIEGKTHPNYANGKICYIEFPAVDINRSAAFYKKVFGWKTRKRKDGSLAFDDSVGEVSGTWVTGRKPSAEPGLLFYIMVDSVEEAIDAVTSNGGKIVQPVGMDAPEITARFSDPAGNVIGLYQLPKP